LNFAKGANPERSDWKKPPLRKPQDSERCYRILNRYMEHAKARPGVRFATARELPLLYESPVSRGGDRTLIARHMAEHQTFLVTNQGTFSAAEMLEILLGIEPAVVEGPIARGQTAYRGSEISRPAFERAKTDAAGFIRANRRLPAEVWIGSEKLSLADFAATLAADNGVSGAIAVRKGNLEFEKYIATDGQRTFNWPIHPEGFSAPELLELGRLQAWTLKPARLK
jgi:glutathione S-transferase